MAAQSQLSKQANGLITLFVKLYQEKHKRAPEINRYKQKWGFQDMVEDLGYDQAKKVIEHFISLRQANHTVQELLFNYDRYSKTLIAREKDREERLALREQTRLRVEEREANGNDGSGSP